MNPMKFHRKSINAQAYEGKQTPSQLHFGELRNQQHIEYKVHNLSTAPCMRALVGGGGSKTLAKNKKNRRFQRFTQVIALVFVNVGRSGYIELITGVGY